MTDSVNFLARSEEYSFIRFPQKAASIYEMAGSASIGKGDGKKGEKRFVNP
jgi:hypothetical protein